MLNILNKYPVSYCYIFFAVICITLIAKNKINSVETPKVTILEPEKIIIPSVESIEDLLHPLYR